jgi:hypothetical protein
MSDEDKNCGIFIYKTSSIPQLPFVSFWENKLTNPIHRVDISTIPFGYYGDYLLTLSAGLKDYPEVKQAKAEIALNVMDGRLPCVVNSFGPMTFLQDLP